MKVWLHRISHCADISYKLLENGYISIGFSDFANIEFLEKTIMESGISLIVELKKLGDQRKGQDITYGDFESI